MKDNCYHGFGKSRQPNGDLYEGQWYMDLQHGFGK